MPPLLAGDPAPYFVASSATRPTYVFDTAAGRYVVLCFLGAAGHPGAAGALALAEARGDLFDDANASFFGITGAASDLAEGRLADRLPGRRFLADPHGLIAASYLRGRDGETTGWFLLDPTLRVLDSGRLEEGERILARLAALPPAPLHAGQEPWAPVLLAPRVFEPGFCDALVAYYREKGGEDSGFMRDVGGRTVGVIDHAHKRRSDCVIEDEALRTEARTRIEKRLLPLIRRFLGFEATRMERYIVACYDGGTGGHFRAHRDNTTKGTAHRRFAVTLNLNDGFEGGELRFPEFGTRTYRAPPGGAIVFSCAMLHEATPVTSGERFAFLPFLYDEAGAKLREANARFLDNGAGNYVANAAAG